MHGSTLHQGVVPGAAVEAVPLWEKWSLCGKRRKSLRLSPELPPRGFQISVCRLHQSGCPVGFGGNLDQILRASCDSACSRFDGRHRVVSAALGTTVRAWYLRTPIGIGRNRVVMAESRVVVDVPAWVWVAPHLGLLRSIRSRWPCQPPARCCPTSTIPQS
jgi:hypothetical protein